VAGRRPTPRLATGRLARIAYAPADAATRSMQAKFRRDRRRRRRNASEDTMTAGSMMPEQRQQNDDRQRHAEQPKKNSASQTHGQLLSIEIRPRRAAPTTAPPPPALQLWQTLTVF